ncbi:hypothetical protein A2886_01000 [candidate division WWE3 bacterium RIFCSPHIGHO2_01_FULL_42_13]|uniref:Glycosyltransferase subfamily 4-like N-terminal domain-containing protein n=1 Tax=candidate division WWE3 bacterium RIFCSPHIGHO2_01_FULL_42_13 TaxID=1802617 RepID=A0A1F4UQH2_UNCKA|nr:MAG: hypothetical protein A2886_01000 [candidate division WWE3 bacterium RIFCSPHIGHO2_01_FULL_42_13]
MKILRIVYDWPPPWDGLAPAPYEMTSAQVKLGHEIDVFCGRWPFAGPIETLKGAKLHPFLREPLRGTLSITTSLIVFFYYLFWRLKNRPDVIHSHGHFAIWIYAYRFFLKKFLPGAKELKVPLIAHFHNTVKGRWEKLEGQDKNIKAISRYLSWPLAQMSDRWAIGSADACIFVSPETKNEAIKHYNTDPSKCFVVETGVNTELFTPIGPEELVKTRGELGLAPHDKVILNNGAIVERKNIHLLIESLRFLPSNYKLLLVGPHGDEEYESKILDVTSKYNLDHRIVRVGYTPYPQVPIVFQIADIFVLPSDWEGLPKVVLQSLACGVPALASGFETSQKIEGLVYLREVSAESIAKQVQEVLDSGISADLGFVRSNYSWHLMAKKVDQVYDKVVIRKS